MLFEHICFIALTLAGSLGRSLSNRPCVQTSSFGTLQMLMHEKTCVISIVLSAGNLCKSVYPDQSK